MKLGPYELNKVHQADVMAGLGRLPDESVHCVVTSPPYWGLRDYGQNGQWGLEATPEEHTARMVAFGRACRRVLRRDGTLWLNYGDCYSTDTKWGGVSGGKNYTSAAGGYQGQRQRRHTGLKPKDLVGMPWRVAFALQGFAVISGGRLNNAADLLAEARESGDWEMVEGVEGMLRAWADLSLWVEPYWNRCDVVWFKSNPMPESVRDRPTRAHEYVFLLTLSAKYFYDSEAVKEACGPVKTCGPNSHADKDRDAAHGTRKQDALGKRTYAGFNDHWRERPASGRNLRSVWAMATQPYPGEHYATFPLRLPDICIRAGTSEKGVCPECGAPWVRVVEKSGGSTGMGDWHDKSDWQATGRIKAGTAVKAAAGDGTYRTSTVGWRPTCGCGRKDAVPAIVLDPFAGSGTTGVVAGRLGRGFIGFDLAGGDKDLGGHTANQRVEAARAGLGLAEYQAGQVALFGQGG